MNADRLAVGDYAQSYLGQSEGAIFVFERSGTAWTEVATIAGENSLDYLGWQLALDGETIVTARPSAFALDASAFEVFEFDGTTWARTATLEVSNGNLELGYKEEFQIALEGDRLLLADFSMDTSDVRGFERSADIWTEKQVFTAPTVLVRTAGDFGASLALDGEDAVIGSYSVAPTGAVGAYSYSTGAWQFDQLLQPTAQLSLAGGFSELLELAHDATRTGDFYVLLGSLSGTTPGFMLQGYLISLNFDSLTLSLIQGPNSAQFPNSLGTLTAYSAYPGVSLPPGTGDVSLEGLTLSLAAVLLDGQAPSTISGLTNALDILIVQ